MKYVFGLFATAFIASAACAAPRIDNVVAKPNPAKFSGSTPPEVEVAVTVVRGKFESGGGCEVSVDPGDGSRARTLEFGTQDKVTQITTFAREADYRPVAKKVFEEFFPDTAKRPQLNQTVNFVSPSMAMAAEMVAVL